MSNISTNTLTSLSGNTVKVNDIANGNVGIGVGQTWQDVTSERASGQDYPNDTGRPIQIALSYNDGGSGEVSVTVDGVVIFTQLYEGSNGINPLSFIVPTDSIYKITLTTDMSIRLWSELR